MAETVEEVLQKAESSFEEKFKGRPTFAVCAPGRVNLIGEHTDYNDGFVFPMVRQMYIILHQRLMSRWPNISQFILCVFLDRDADEVHQQARQIFSPLDQTSFLDKGFNVLSLLEILLSQNFENVLP